MSAGNTKNWFALEAREALRGLDSSEQGLANAEAAKRLAQYGPNKIEEEKQASAWDILKAQLVGFFNIVLYAAVVVAGLVGEWRDFGFILFILIVNTVLAFYQEYKASRIMSGLKNLLVDKVNALRGGAPVEVPGLGLVPGDIIMLEEGMRVPADARLIKASALSIDEAMLTGESVPAEKTADSVSPDAALGDRTCMIFSGTTIVRGTGLAVITGTGMNTELGTIAKALQETETPKTSFEVEIDKLSRQITFVIVFLVIISAGLLWLHHDSSFGDIAIFALSLGVGAIPECLPVVLSFALAMGAQHMAQNNALARRLAIVESLGSVDVICTDKTGTLTKNEMTVQQLYVASHDPYYVTGTGYDPRAGEIQTRHVGTDRLKLPLFGAILCNDSRRVEKDGVVSYMGDPTEIALRVVAEKGGLDSVQVAQRFPRVGEFPFTSDRQRMTTLHMIEGKKTALTKGAPEVVIGRCDKVYIHGEFVPMTEETRTEIHEVLEHLESQALRVLAIAGKYVSDGDSEEQIESSMCFLGLVGMIDPPRDEVRTAIAQAKVAGIRTVMITGDHATTAKAIGACLGIGQNHLTGPEVEAMSDEELRGRVEDIDIVARATPVVKLRVLKAIRANKHFAAMTGDGVNDSPALKQADVGVAMGLRGTDAAKQAAGVVLLDDNYATIVRAVEQGRRIFDNIRKFVNYLLTCNVGEVITVMLGAIFGLAPLTAIMVLWINLLTDIMPAISLGVDPANPGLMKRKPRKHDEHILNKGLIWTTLIIGLKKGVENFLVFAVGYWWIASELAPDDRLAYAQTMAFTGIVIYAFVRIVLIRQFDSLGIWSNPWLLISLVVAAVVQIFIIYTPEVSKFFGLMRLDWKAWGVLGLLAVWAGVTGVWVTRWIERWSGGIIDNSGSAEKQSA